MFQSYVVACLSVFSYRRWWAIR